MPTELLAQHDVSFAGHLARYKPHFILGGLFALIGVGLLAIDHADENAGTFWPGVIVTAFSLTWGLPVLLGYRRRIKSVRVFDDGIAWIIQGTEVFRSWDDLREVFRSWKPVRLSLVFKKKETIVFDPTLNDFFQLASLIEAITTDQMMPRYRQALDQDGADFGPILLKRGGLRINNRDFTWGDVEEYAIVGGGIVVTPFEYDDFTGEHVNFEVIPNYLILLRLLEELDQRPTPAEQCIMVAGRKKGCV